MDHPVPPWAARQHGNAGQELERDPDLPAGAHMECPLHASLRGLLSAPPSCPAITGPCTCLSPPHRPPRASSGRSGLPQGSPVTHPHCMSRALSLHWVETTQALLLRLPGLSCQSAHVCQSARGDHDGEGPSPSVRLRASGRHGLRCAAHPTFGLRRAAARNARPPLSVFDVSKTGEFSGDTREQDAIVLCARLPHSNLDGSAKMVPGSRECRGRPVLSLLLCGFRGAQAEPGPCFPRR